MRNMSFDANQRITHFNYPQQRAWVVNANITVAIIGRAGGKTHGFIAPVSIRNVKGMPRGATGFTGPTYMKIKGDLIPALIKALEKLGFYEEIDFWVGKFIPKNIRHEKPYECPTDPSYSIFWRNGHVWRLIGLDRKDSGNAQSNDFIINDESKFTKIEQFNSRIVPTNRGNEDVFSHLHYHHGMMFCTDMPTNPDAKWIFEFEKHMDPDQIDLIVTYDHQQQELIKSIGDDLISIDPTISLQVKSDKEKLLDAMRVLVAKEQLTEALDTRFRKELARLDKLLFELRREAVYFLEASTLDNIDVVTERYIRQMKRVLTTKQFNTSILNLREAGADFGFYGNLDTDIHGYTDIDYEYVDRFKDFSKLPEPWKKDADINVRRPLQIACDWGAKILCMEVGQEFQHVFKYLNSLDVEHPFRIKHLAKKFDEYYEGFPTRELVHHYDHTAIHEDASREISYAQELAQELTALGWQVTDHYIGQASRHDSRYKLFARVHAEDDPDTKPCRYNRINCANLLESLEGAATFEDRRGHQKDKRPENRASVDPKKATHHSDAHDTLYIGVFQDRIGVEEFIPGFTA